MIWFRRSAEDGRGMRPGMAGVLAAVVLASCAAPESPAVALQAACTVEESGQLDTRLIDEASGLAVSRRFPGRLYHINDSGDSGRFFQTAMDGSGTRPIAIEGFSPIDTEDLTFGPCGSVDGDCLYIADIGDNNRRRNEIRIVVVREIEEFPERVAPVASFALRYPDGPHDAESLALHPNGDLFILTKSADYALLEVHPSRMYRLGFDQRLTAGAEPLVLEPVGGGDIEFTAFSSDTFSGSLPTAADISADGSRLLVLTYVNAFEFYTDLSESPIGGAAELVAGEDFREIPLTVEVQQEAIAYLGDGEFLYTSEQASADDAPIFSVRCEA